jgi:hypothetical protein
VRVYSDQKLGLSAILANCGIHPCSLNTLGIVQQYDARIQAREPVDDGAAPINTAPIRNYQFQIDTVCLGYKPSNNVFDVIFLVEAGHNDKHWPG